MRLDIRLHFEFGAQLPAQALKDIPNLLEEANQGILKKGCPEGKEEEASEVREWRFEGVNLFLRILSGRYVRAHHAVKRLRNFLSENIGKKYKTGIRKVFIDRFEIQYELDRAPEKEITLPFVQKLEIRGNTAYLELENLSEDLLESGIDRLLDLLDDKIKRQGYGGKAEHWEILWESPHREPIWTSDPTQEMIKHGWIVRYLPGIWYHSFTSSKILRTIEQICLEELLNPIEFQEVIIPKVTPFNIWLKTGHMPGSAPTIFYMSQPKSWDPEFWEDLSDYVKVTGEIPMKVLGEKLKEPFGGACYAQCPPLYSIFERQLLDEEDMPLKFFDRSGPSYRYEAGGLHGIERDTEFHRIELVWFGGKEQALQIKDQIMEKYKHIFNDVMELEWRMAWVTPWYMAQTGEKGVEEAKEKGTIDFEGWLPWRGSRKESEWLEFQNLTIAGTKFSDAFKFKIRPSKEAWTGCSGIGLERWMSVFLSQKGLDPKNWPRSFRDYLSSLPREPKTLKL